MHAGVQELRTVVIAVGFRQPPGRVEAPDQGEQVVGPDPGSARDPHRVSRLLGGDRPRGVVAPVVDPVKGRGDMHRIHCESGQPQLPGQRARFYTLPLRSSGVCAANVPDGQAMWETSNSLWSAVQSGTNIVYHAAGWLEGGLIASPEKFVMDCEVLQMIQRYMEPEITATGPDDIALDAIREVGSSGHYFGIEHTQARYESAFYQPFVSDWRNYEAFAADGEVWTAERAHRLFKRIIEAFEAPPLAIEEREALVDFVERRKSEGGAPTDF